MRIPSGKVDQYIYFVAVDSVDLKTKKTGLTGFTVLRERNGLNRSFYTTPTIVELDSVNCPGLYRLLVDEDTSIAAASDAEEYVVHINVAGMAPVIRVIELFRRDTTSGRTQLVDANGRVDVSAIAGTAQTARDIGASVLLSSGTGTGQVSLTAGVVAANATQIAGAAVNTATAQLGVNVISAAGTAWNSGAITSNTFAAGALTAAKFAANALDAVWSTTTRLLSAGTNIVLAKGTGVTGFNDLDAPGVRTAVGMASANLDTQLAGISTKTANLPPDPADASDIVAAFGTVNANVGTVNGTVNAIKAKTDNIPAAPAAVGDIPTANANADALLDRAAGVEAGMTLRQASRLWSAALIGKANGLGTGTAIFRDTNDTKDRINASVDQDGNRLAVILDPS
ncbi:MAG: hypothetical protein EOQ39_22390 [Mesorhizobium sp.]|uniref:hypothetical protein n=1 Tax=Mesorhizobium sp. TaxID=1871066 RepID=UPI000FEA9A80|nr:hypothetical protein [Mesorhizobium sp.]RWB05472.1 MAG: hypothetical protein EOQ37_14520 [Mesorhizobium sp.]RWB12557.1 MAG: hypothetical protein EOQ39_22390 [Mesorhizobium sp.]